MSGRQWIASEAWTGAAVLHTPNLMPYLSGTLGIAIRRGEIPGLRKFLQQIHPKKMNNSRNSMVSTHLEQYHIKFQEYSFAFMLIVIF